MIYVVFNPSTQVAYCRMEYKVSVNKLITRMRCREYEYRNNLREVGEDYKRIMRIGGLEKIRIAIAEPDEERPWPYTEFTSYKHDDDMKYWLDTHPRAKINPISTEEEYKKERNLLKNWGC